MLEYNFSVNLFVCKQYINNVPQARACGGLGAAHASMGAHAEAARWHESRLRHATAAGKIQSVINVSELIFQKILTSLLTLFQSCCLGDTRGRAQALADLGRAHLAMGACGSAVSYLRQALAATEGLADVDEEVKLSFSLII